MAVFSNQGSRPCGPFGADNGDAVNPAPAGIDSLRNRSIRADGPIHDTPPMAARQRQYSRRRAAARSPSRRWPASVTVASYAEWHRACDRRMWQYVRSQTYGSGISRLGNEPMTSPSNRRGNARRGRLAQSWCVSGAAFDPRLQTLWLEMDQTGRRL